MPSYVISGGPATGKTSVIIELKRLGYNVIEEVAREVATEDKRFSGKRIKEIDWVLFHEAIFKLQKEKLEKLDSPVVFLDRSVGDLLAYDKIHKVETTKERLDFAKKFRHDKIFILDFLDFYETDDVRDESVEEQEEIHNAIIEAYEKLRYKIIFVPFMKIEERVRFILNNIKDFVEQPNL